MSENTDFLYARQKFTLLQAEMGISISEECLKYCRSIHLSANGELCNSRLEYLIGEDCRRFG